MIKKWIVRISFLQEVSPTEPSINFATTLYQDIYLDVYAKTVEGAEGAAINTLTINGIVNMPAFKESDYDIAVYPSN